MQNRKHEVKLFTGGVYIESSKKSAKKDKCVSLARL